MIPKLLFRNLWLIALPGVLGGIFGGLFGIMGVLAVIPFAILIGFYYQEVESYFYD